jgi:peptidyl-prolyl cis-trans isomerase B (cyclophilin B)
MKKNIKILLVISLITLLITGCSFGNVKREEKDMSKIHHVRMEIEKYGTVELELDGTVAPITVDNFISLAKSGFYDGLTFHRNMKGFMAQGGDPTGTGTGGSPNTIKGEFAANGVRNSISHVRGTISMAREPSNYDSASSQFFIVHEDSTFLDGNYAAFGRVTSGMEAIDNLLENTKVEDDNGTTLKENQPVIKKVTVID